MYRRSLIGISPDSGHGGAATRHFSKTCMIGGDENYFSSACCPLPADGPRKCSTVISQQQTVIVHVSLLDYYCFPNPITLQRRDDHDATLHSSGVRPLASQYVVHCPDLDTQRAEESRRRVWIGNINQGG